MSATFEIGSPAVVVGAQGGIGAACVEKLQLEGVHTVALDLPDAGDYMVIQAIANRQVAASQGCYWLIGDSGNNRRVTLEARN